MRSSFALGGTIGLGIVLIAAVMSALIWLGSPVSAVPDAKQLNYPAPDAAQFATQATATGIDQAAQIDLIRGIMAKPGLQLAFDSTQGLANVAGRDAAVYVDQAGSKYYIDMQTGRLAEIDAGALAHEDVHPAQALSMDELRSIATRFAQANSTRLAELQPSLVYDEGCKGTLCFFRWDARNLPIDWSGTEWAIMPPFLQVGVLADGQVLTYYNSLDLFQGTVPVEAPQPTPTGVLGGGTVQDGPFTFDLRIFQDPTLTSQPVAPSLYSDLPGFGSYLYWSYTGTEVIGPVTTYWGTEPQVEQLLQATYSLVRVGSSGGRTGGIILPGGPMQPGQSKVGDREHLVLKVTTPSGEYGGVLAFTLKQGTNGLEPVDISVEALGGP